jgi:hypothetical protein
LGFEKSTADRAKRPELCFKNSRRVFIGFKLGTWNLVIYDEFIALILISHRQAYVTFYDELNTYFLISIIFTFTPNFPCSLLPKIKASVALMDVVECSYWKGNRAHADNIRHPQISKSFSFFISLYAISIL